MGATPILCSPTVLSKDSTTRSTTSLISAQPRSTQIFKLNAAPKTVRAQSASRNIASERLSEVSTCLEPLLKELALCSSGLFLASSLPSLHHLCWDVRVVHLACDGPAGSILIRKQHADHEADPLLDKNLLLKHV